MNIWSGVCTSGVRSTIKAIIISGNANKSVCANISNGALKIVNAGLAAIIKF